VLTEIRERQLSTLKNVDGGASCLKEVLTEIRERPPSILNNIDGGLPERH
jgi:hypothetical protein